MTSVHILLIVFCVSISSSELLSLKPWRLFENENVDGNTTSFLLFVKPVTGTVVLIRRRAIIDSTSSTVPSTISYFQDVSSKNPMESIPFRISDVCTSFDFVSMFVSSSSKIYHFGQDSIPRLYLGSAEETKSIVQDGFPSQHRLNFQYLSGKTEVRMSYHSGRLYFSSGEVLGRVSGTTSMVWGIRIGSGSEVRAMACSGRVGLFVIVTTASGGTAVEQRSYVFTKQSNVIVENESPYFLKNIALLGYDSWRKALYIGSTEGYILSYEFESSSPLNFVGLFREYKWTNVAVAHTALYLIAENSSTIFSGALPSVPQNSYQNFFSHTVTHAEVKDDDTSVSASSFGLGTAIACLFLSSVNIREQQVQAALRLRLNDCRKTVLSEQKYDELLFLPWDLHLGDTEYMHHVLGNTVLLVVYIFVAYVAHRLVPSTLLNVRWPSTGWIPAVVLQLGFLHNAPIDALGIIMIIVWTVVLLTLIYVCVHIVVRELEFFPNPSTSFNLLHTRGSWESSEVYYHHNLFLQHIHGKMSFTYIPVVSLLSTIVTTILVLQVSYVPCEHFWNVSACLLFTYAVVILYAQFSWWWVLDVLASSVYILMGCMILVVSPGAQESLGIAASVCNGFYALGTWWSYVSVVDRHTNHKKFELCKPVPGSTAFCNLEESWLEQGHEQENDSMKEKDLGTYFHVPISNVPMSFVERKAEDGTQQPSQTEVNSSSVKSINTNPVFDLQDYLDLRSSSTFSMQSLCDAPPPPGFVGHCHGSRTTETDAQSVVMVHVEDGVSNHSDMSTPSASPYPNFPIEPVELTQRSQIMHISRTLRGVVLNPQGFNNNKALESL